MIREKVNNVTRYIFVTGGVSSSLGKGLTASALGALLQARGYKIRIRKLDPYLNVDPGTMSPYQHGEVYVTDDGAETDLDLGHYERFTGVSSRKSDNITTGKIYSNILTKERRGDYLGSTVQVIPHVTDEIKSFVLNESDDVDFLICEIGGTVGDIESLPFVEAIRQLGNELGREKTLYIHLTLLPYIQSAGELKTKPTQHSVKELLSVGIQPDILVCRCDREIPKEARDKIALFCNLRKEAVIAATDADTIYQVPLNLYDHGLDTEVYHHFGLPLEPRPDLRVWHKITETVLNPEGSVTIAVVGKYTELEDAYKSLVEALNHGGIANKVKVRIKWIEGEVFEKEEALDILDGVHGVLVPGGFGQRGTEGMMKVVRFARERNIPYFGICLGMQLAVIETARNVAKIKEAGSSEFGSYNNSIIGLMTEWVDGETLQQRQINGDLGGTMRLGAYTAHLSSESRIFDIYEKEKISERHRHRYEMNIKFKEKIEKTGLKITGLSPDGNLPEVVEHKNHPWFIGVQFHPELKSKPFEPHPLFTGFVKASIEQSRLV